MALNPKMTIDEEDDNEPIDMSEPTDDDNQSMLEELDRAAEAGDNHEAKASFEDVPGADPISEANEMPDDADDEEKLKAALAQMGG